jgi:hypothetical protein
MIAVQRQIGWYRRWELVADTECSVQQAARRRPCEAVPQAAYTLQPAIHNSCLPPYVLEHRS